MNKANSDTWTGIIFLLFCSFAWWQIDKLPTGVGNQNTIGSEFFPQIMTAAIAFFSLLLIARSFWKAANSRAKSTAIATGVTLWRMGLFMALLVVYVFIYESLGFVLSSVIILPVGMFMLGERRILHVVILPCILVGIAWLIFTKIMMVPLPEFPFNW